MRALFGRFFYADDDEVAPRRLRGNVRGGEVALLPAIVFHQLSFRVVDVDGDLGFIDFGAEPEPVLVTLEELLLDRFLFRRAEIAAPIIFAHLETILHVRFGSLQSESLRIIDRCERAARGAQKSDTERNAQCVSYKERHTYFVTIWSSNFAVISLIRFTESAEMGSRTSINGRTCPSAT